MINEATPILSKPQNRKYVNEQRPSLDIKVGNCIIAILLYLAFGVFSYSCILQEQWSFIDSLYFAVVTMTTVGYGDLAPDTIISKIFTCFFALGGVTFIGIALGVIVARLIENEEKAFAKEESRASFSFLSSEQEPNVKDNSNQELPSLYHQFFQLFVKYLPVFIVLYLGACVIGLCFEDWNFIEIFYYFIVTSTTIGYGDLSPTNQYGRLYDIFFILVSVGIMGYAIGEVGNLILERRRQRLYHYLKKRPLRMEHLLEMDADGDQKVSLLEYVEFMLKAMEKVDDELLKDIKEQFDRIDSTRDGFITKQDLQQRYQRKWKSAVNIVHVAKRLSESFTKCTEESV